LLDTPSIRSLAQKTADQATGCSLFRVLSPLGSNTPEELSCHATQEPHRLSYVLDRVWFVRIRLFLSPAALGPARHEPSSNP